MHIEIKLEGYLENIKHWDLVKAVEELADYWDLDQTVTFMKAYRRDDTGGD